MRGCPFVSFEFVPVRSVITRSQTLINPVQIPFLFITIKNNGQRGDNMAKSHYSFKKRKKELARKLKQEKKRQRKLDKGKPEEALDESQNEALDEAQNEVLDEAQNESQDEVKNPLT